MRETRTGTGPEETGGRLFVAPDSVQPTEAEKIASEKEMATRSARNRLARDTVELERLAQSVPQDPETLRRIDILNENIGVHKENVRHEERGVELRHEVARMLPQELLARRVWVNSEIRRLSAGHAEQDERVPEPQKTSDARLTRGFLGSLELEMQLLNARGKALHLPGF